MPVKQALKDVPLIHGKLITVMSTIPAADLNALISKSKAAQKQFATFTQEQVDLIFRKAAFAAAGARIPLAKLAVEETHMGLMEDKVVKNHFASEYIYNKYKDERTCGILEEDKEYGTLTIAEPVRLICAIVPTTKPDLDRDLQGADQPQDPQWHHLLPAPARP